MAIVEDELDLLSIYSDHLMRLGYDSVATFSSGEDFFVSVSEGKVAPDLVILDYRLPGIDGIETARRARAINSDVKIIVTTADDSVRDAARSMGLFFLLKPFSMQALMRLIERV